MRRRLVRQTEGSLAARRRHGVAPPFLAPGAGAGGTLIFPGKRVILGLCRASRGNVRFRGHYGSSISVRLAARRANQSPVDPIPLPVKPRLKKYSDFQNTQITTTKLPSRPTRKGRSRSSRTRGGMRWTRMALLDEGASRGRRSRVVPTPRRWRQVLKKQALLGGGGDKKPDRREERGVSRKNHRAGKAGCFRWTCSD